MGKHVCHLTPETPIPVNISIYCRLQVNHLGTALLALLLLPVLAATPSHPRITIVSSEVHYWLKRLNEADSDHILNKLNDPKTADMGKRYHVTKRKSSFTVTVKLINSNGFTVFNVFFTRALADRLKPEVPVIVNSINPGLCVSEVRIICIPSTKSL